MRPAPNGTVVGATVLLVCSMLVACGLQPQNEARPIDRDEVPFGLLESTTTTLAVLRSDELACAAGADSVVSVNDAEVVADVQLEGRTAVVELVDEVLSSLGADGQLVAVAQLTCAITSEPGVDDVRFRQEGRSLEVPREDGSLTSDAVGREDYAGLLGS